MKTLTLITGANRGLGLGLLRWAQDQGHSILNFSRTKLDPLAPEQQVLEGAEKIPGQKNSSSSFYREISVDFSNPNTYLGKLPQTFQSIDLKNFERVILFNNAAMIEPISPIKDLLSHQISKAVQVNLTAPMQICQEFMKATEDFQGKIWVINISSGAAYRPIPSWSVYCSTKAGLKMFTDSLALENKSQPNKRFLNFSPGIMDTGMQAQIRQTSESQFPLVNQFKDYFSQSQLSSPESVANVLGRYLDSLEANENLLTPLKTDLDVSELRAKFQ